MIADNDDIFGDGVNIAARLETICPPGRICVSQAVRSSVGSQSEFIFQEVALIKAARYEGDYEPTEDDFLVDGLKPDIKNFKTFVFEDGPEGRGLKFLFAHYQLGAYAEGSFEVLVPVGILAEFVKEDYQAWFEPVPTDTGEN